MDNFDNLLVSLFSSNQVIRKDAEEALIVYKKTNFSEILFLTFDALKTQNNFYAAVLFKTLLKDLYITDKNIWFKIDNERREYIIKFLFNLLKQRSGVSNVLSVALSYICVIEIENGFMLDLYSTIYDILMSGTIDDYFNMITLVFSIVKNMKSFNMHEQTYFLLKLFLKSKEKIHAMKELLETQNILKKIIKVNHKEIINILIEVLLNNNKDCDYENEEEVKINSLLNIVWILRSVDVETDFWLYELKKNILMFIKEDDLVSVQAIEFFATLCESNPDSILDILESLIPKLLNFALLQDYEKDWNCHKESIACLEIIASTFPLLLDESIRNIIEILLNNQDVNEVDKGVILLGALSNISYHGRYTSISKGFDKKEKNHCHITRKFKEAMILNEHKMTLTKSISKKLIQNEQNFNLLKSKNIINTQTIDINNGQNYTFDNIGIINLSVFYDNIPEFFLDVNDNDIVDVLKLENEKIAFVGLQQIMEESFNFENNIYSSDASTFIALSLTKIIHRLEISPDLNIKTDETFRESCLWTIKKLIDTNKQCLDVYENVIPFIEKLLIIIRENCKESIAAAYTLSALCKAQISFNENGGGRDALLNFGCKMIEIVSSTYDVAGYQNYALRAALCDTLCDVINTLEGNKQVNHYIDKLYRSYGSKIYECIEYSKKATYSQTIVIGDFLVEYLIIIQAYFIYNEKTSESDIKKDILRMFILTLSEEKLNLIHADIYRLLSSITEEKNYFGTSTDKFIPFVIRDLDSKNKDLLLACITYIGDIASFLHIGFIKFASKLVPKLIDIIYSQTTPKETKPLTLSILGDIALVMGKSFEIYFEKCFNILNFIVEAERELDEEYFDDLRFNSLLLLKSMIVSLQKNIKIKENMGNISKILKIIIINDKDSKNTPQCIKVIGEILYLYGINEQNQWMLEALNHYSQSNEFKQVADDVLNMVNKCSYKK